MKFNLINISLLLAITFFLASCSTQRTSTLSDTNYNKTKNETHYSVLNYGSVTLPGKWKKTRYNVTSKQQFFKNRSSVEISVTLGRIDKYKFNKDGSLTGYNFIKAYYEDNSKYYVDSLKFNTQILESDSTNNFMIYRVYGQNEKGDYNVYFLQGVKKGNTSDFMITSNHKWSESEKIKFLKNLLLTKKEEE